MIGLRELGVLILVGAVGGCSSSTTPAGTGGSGGVGGSAGGGGVGGSAAPLLDEYVLMDEALVPESGIFDPTSRSFFVGSATQGSITQVEADGTESVLFSAPPGETWGTFGITVDDAARRLWVCARRTDVMVDEIWVFDLVSGDRDLVFDLTDVAEDSTCNDVAVDGNGLAYVSDSENPRVYRADADDETAVVWADDPLLSPNETGTFGGNGIAVTEDDGYVIVSKTGPSSPPRLLRIALDDASSIDEVVTTPALEGFADGMAFLDGALYVAMVAAGDVARLTSDDDWATASVVTGPAGPGGPVPGTSTVRVAEDALYAIYSDITRTLLGMTSVPPFRIFKVDLETFE